MLAKKLLWLIVRLVVEPRSTAKVSVPAPPSIVPPMLPPPQVKVSLPEPKVAPCIAPVAPSVKLWVPVAALAS